MVSSTALLNGISALVILLFEFAMGILFLILFKKRKKRLMPIIALMGFLTGMFYLGPSISFLSLIFGNNNITYTLYGYLSYTTMPINICLAMYVGYDIFEPEKKKNVVLFYSLTGIIYWIALFGFNSFMILPVDLKPGDLMDVRLSSAVLILSALYILSVLFILGGGFNKLKNKLPLKSIERKRSGVLATGWVLFAIGAFLDTLISSELIVIARIIMLVALISINYGFYSK